MFDGIWENNSFPLFHLLNARSFAGTMALLTDNWLQWGLTEYYNYNNLYYALFVVMVIRYMHTNSKWERGPVRRTGIIGRSHKQSRSTDSCAIHGFLRNVWIHRLCSAIHGLRRSTDCSQHLYSDCGGSVVRACD